VNYGALTKKTDTYVTHQRLFFTDNRQQC